MYLTVLLSSGLVIGLAIGGGVLLLLALFLLVRFVFFGRVAIKKAVGDLENRYERSHAILFGTDTQYINRLESISGMNLTYVDDFERWKREYSVVRDDKDAMAIGVINDLKDLLEEGRFRDVKEDLPDAKKKIEDFEKAVKALDEGLCQKFADEDACKNLVLSLQERLRAVKASYSSRASDLELVAPSFNKIYGKLENLISESNELVDDAKYSEARHLLEGKAEPVLKALTDSYEELPDLCLTLTRVLPSKINALENSYLNLTERGYPLGHLLSKEEPKRLRDEVARLSEATARFELKGIATESKRLLDKCERLTAAFQKEVEARKEFEGNSKNSYRDSDYVSEKYLDLRQAMPQIRTIYVISPEADHDFEVLDGAVASSQATKRMLDTYVHSSAKQPYSVLLDKTRSLMEEGKNAMSALKRFQDYLASLKSGSEEASRILKSYYERTKNAESCLRAMYCEPLEQSYKGKFDALYALLDELYGVLSKKPIDVDRAVALSKEITANGEEVISAVDKLDTERLESEKAIVIANRHRLSYPGADSLLKQAETFYFSGDYQRSEATAAQVAGLRPREGD